MKNLVLRLTMVLLLFVSGSMAYADDTYVKPKSPVYFASKVEVVCGHSYTGDVAVTIKYKNGLRRVQRLTVTIDYGLLHKHIDAGGWGYADYDSDCKYLKTDDMAMFYVAELFGGDNVELIYVEMSLKQW